MAKKKQPEPPVHPQLSPLITLCLGIVTLGVYSYIWTSRRYREIDDDASWISHWLVPTVIAMVALVFGANLTTTVPFILKPGIGAVVTVVGYYVLWGFVQAVGAWWMVVYMMRIDENQKRIPLAIMTFFFSPIAVFYLQSKLDNRTWVRRTHARRLVVAVSVLASLSVVATVCAVYPVKNEIRVTESLFYAISEYTQCHEDLQRRYPNKEIGAYQYQVYSDAYDDCEAILE